ncbi:universal stress protein [Ruegeria sp. R14_0]|uniref:universal stress protein n=1 Tax=Ruegeria sp. R14_0 TaxID=2821100 RepID=UPI001ADBCE0F|nr:universal stress protein [Ruegeria sp. R14_0]MBO9444988.1 universal stress protein [Ruegeria sp. R14_0]
MTNAVLCAVDISNGDLDAPVLKKAAALADQENAQLDVVTVLPDFGESWVSGFFESDFHDKALEEAHTKLAEMCVAAVGADRNEKIRHVVATGTAYQEILKTAESAGSDLIVIGAHKPDFKDYLLGPNAARVVRHSSVSVYVVR